LALPWILEKEGLAAWSSYEQAWGNPTPPYSTDWRHGGPLVDQLIEEGFELSPATFSARVKCLKVSGDKVTSGFGETTLIAATRAWVAKALGEEVDVPEELLS